MQPPLADKLRPQSLGDFVGQSHLVEKHKPISQSLQTQSITSMIFWGPPGSGKTTLAKIIASGVNAKFHHLSAVAAGKADVRKIVQQAKKTDDINILFLDEIHRFNKAQQDYLLPYVEDGTLILIGATTENPSFSVINALLSRCQVYVLHAHSEKELAKIINRGYAYLSKSKDTLDGNSLDFLIQFANGDARKAINLIEAAHSLFGKIDPDTLARTVQSHHLRYDRNAEEHYDTISAFIKSMRASDPNAAIYYLARMIEGGEDPLFIARRMVVFASEDIGMAQPTALVVANEVFRACETIGYPECAINLSHGTIYLSLAKKDRRAYDAIKTAQKDVHQYGNLKIPLNLRNAPTKLMKDLGYGQGYEKYPKGNNLLPDKLHGKKYFKLRD